MLRIAIASAAFATVISYGALSALAQSAFRKTEISRGNSRRQYASHREGRELPPSGQTADIDFSATPPLCSRVPQKQALVASI
jgi:hypothetical protein